MFGKWLKNKKQAFHLQISWPKVVIGWKTQQLDTITSAFCGQKRGMAAN